MTDTSGLETLLKECHSGNELAWEALVCRFQGRVFSIGCHYLGDPEEARDIAQEVFVKIYRSLGTRIDAQGFFPWVVKITRNACIDSIRRKKARPPVNDIDLDTMRDLPVPANNPEEELAASSRRRLIYRALGQLTDLNREIIILKDIQGLQLEEIASMLHVPLGTIKSRSNRARIELAEKVLALSNPCQAHPMA